MFLLLIYVIYFVFFIVYFDGRMCEKTICDWFVVLSNNILKVNINLIHKDDFTWRRGRVVNALD